MHRLVAYRRFGRERGVGPAGDRVCRRSRIRQEALPCSAVQTTSWLLDESTVPPSVRPPRRQQGCPPCALSACLRIAAKSILQLNAWPLRTGPARHIVQFQHPSKKSCMSAKKMLSSCRCMDWHYRLSGPLSLPQHLRGSPVFTSDSLCRGVLALHKWAQSRGEMPMEPSVSPFCRRVFHLPE